MKIVLATRNRKKSAEISRMFPRKNLHILTLDEFPGLPEVEEDGKTFRANAVKKAVTIARKTGLIAIADDSGLSVKALDGAPGVFSARYAGEKASDANNVKKLLKDLRGVPFESRQARFVCCIALAFPDGQCKTFTGMIQGSIGLKPKGYNGFGYDPVFYPDGYQRTFAEMTSDEKDSLSHRGRALKKLFIYIHTVL